MQTKIFFKVFYVFDVSDTDGRPLPRTQIIVTGDDKGLFKILEHIAEQRNIELKYQELKELHCGTSYKVHIVLDSGLDGAGKTLAIVHKMAH